MSYDPSLPAPGSPLQSHVVRDQLNALKALIDAIATDGITGAQIAAVNSVEPGQPAGVSVQIIGGVMHFTFEIPRGVDGTDGTNGAPGPQGPPFANAIIGGVSTLNAGENAWVTVSFDGTNVTFFFGIPRGIDGASGITQQQLDNAIPGTSRNSNNVPTLMQGADANFNQSQMQGVMNKIDELINALRR